MASDLDRAYVINGDDLRIALAGMNGRWPTVPNPRTMAGDIIDVIARPLALGESADVVDAHICCEHEHLHEDPELSLMAEILRGMAALAPDARQRIRQWVDERFVPTRYSRG